MKKVFNVFLAFYLSVAMVYGDTVSANGSEAASSNVPTTPKDEKKDGYTNAETGKTYKSEADISPEDRTKLKAPLTDNLFKSTDWSLFLKEFEINWDVGFCGSGLDLALGFRASMIEPLGYMEISKKPLHFPFADLDLGGNAIKSCSSRGGSEEEAARDECFYQHFVFAPIMGMIFKKKLKFVCFHQGNIALPIIAEFDPTHLIDIYNMKTIVHIIAMVSPQAIVSSIINCASTMAYSGIKGYATNSTGSSDQEWDSTSWANQYEDPNERYENFEDSSTFKRKGLESLAFIRNTMYYNLGCLGMHPVGGYSEGNDPVADASLLAYGALSKAHAATAITQIPIVRKQTEFGMELLGDVVSASMPGSTLCKAKNFPLAIETQYVLQRAYPTVADGKEFGETAMTLSTLANVPGKDSVVDVLWLRRDYYAFAYWCKDSFGTEYK